MEYIMRMKDSVFIQKIWELGQDQILWVLKKDNLNKKFMTQLGRQLVLVTWDEELSQSIGKY